MKDILKGLTCRMCLCNVDDYFRLFAFIGSLGITPQYFIEGLLGNPSVLVSSEIHG